MLASGKAAAARLPAVRSMGPYELSWGFGRRFMKMSPFTSTMRDGGVSTAGCGTETLFHRAATLRGCWAGDDSA